MPFPIACGACNACSEELYSLCENSNPNAPMAARMFGHSPAGIYGYSHLMGGYAGGQAEYARVPFADVDHLKVPDGMTDEQVLFLSDILPTGYMAAEQCGIEPGDTVAVWGCGPVGLFAIKSAYLLGAERVIGIDRVPARLEMAAEKAGAETLNFEDVDVYDALLDMTGGLGPDACIDAVGMEAHGPRMWSHAYDRAKQAVMRMTDRVHVIRQMIQSCRKGGILSIMGVYAMFADKIPLGAAFNKGLHWRMGQMHGPKYMPRLFEFWRQGKVDPGIVFTHRFSLDDAPRAYETFKLKQGNCVKVLLQP